MKATPKLTPAEGAPGRVPPQNLEAEESVLGACMMASPKSQEMAGLVLQELEVGDFYRPANKRIFEAIGDLYGAGEPVDVVTVAAKLQARGVLDWVGGKPYLFTVVSSCPTAGSAMHYAALVKDASDLRKLIQAADRIRDLAYGSPEDVQGIVIEAGGILLEALSGRATKDLVTSDEVVTRTLESLERAADLADHGMVVTGSPTGIEALDLHTGGHQKGELTIIAARPSMGKTSAMLQGAIEDARKGPTIFFSVEMPVEQLGVRMFAVEGEVPMESLKRFRLDSDQMARHSQAMGRLAELRLWVDESPGLTMMEMWAKCRALAAKEGPLQAVYVDYVQLMARGDDLTREVGKIAQQLKMLAREMECPVIVASQLSRNLESRMDKRPILADMRDSGKLEEVADVVVMLYRDAVYSPETDRPDEAEFLIRKFRQGAQGTVRVPWRDHIVKFG